MLLLFCGQAIWYNHFGQLFGSFLELDTELQYDLAIPLLGIGPREIKFHAYTKTYMQRFIAALLIIVPNSKQPK